jgi:hypothetical protein
MPTPLDARFAIVNETLRTTRGKLAELARALAKLRAGDPGAEQLQRQYMEIHRQRQAALAEQGELIEEARGLLKAKTERLEQLRKGEK